ncbi:MAG: hypothetical protein C4522_18345 [Desulfobacteraceae bacterium]|nr:MAG: hypothetical protein C4522_18345 [Desulfobacteraceae bacterium]
MMGLFMRGIKDHVERTKSLNETQLLIALLKAAHYVEAGNDINHNFEVIARNYITRFFGKHKLSDKIDTQEMEKLFSKMS